MRPVLLDLADQDQRVAHEDARQRNQAEDRVEAERLARHEQGRNDADQPQRSSQQNDGHVREAADLQHDDDHHQQQHDRENGRQRLVGLARLLDRAALGDLVAGGQRRNERLQLLEHRGRDVRRLKAVCDVAAHGDGRHAIPAKQDRVLHPQLELADLAERNPRAIGRRQREVGDPGRIEALRTR